MTKLKPGSIKQRIMDALSDGDPASTYVLAQRLGLDNIQQANQACATLKNEGLLVRVGLGVYEVAPEPEPEPDPELAAEQGVLALTTSTTVARFVPCSDCVLAVGGTCRRLALNGWSEGWPTIPDVDSPGCGEGVQRLTA